MKAAAEQALATCVKEFDQHMDQITSQLVQSMANSQEWRRRHEASERQLQQLRQENQGLRQENQQLRQDTQQLKQENQRLVSNNQGLAQHVDGLKTTENVRTVELHKSQAEVVRLNRVIKEMETAHRSVQISLDLRSRDLAEARAQGQQAFDEAKVKAEKQVEAEHNKLKDQLRKNTQKMTELENEKQAAIAQVRSELAEATKQESQAKAETSRTKAESIRLRAENQKLVATTTEQEERIKALETEGLSKAAPPSTPQRKSSGEASAETPSSSKHLKRELESERMKNVHARQALSTMDTFFRAIGDDLGLELSAGQPDDTFDQRGEAQRKSVRAIVKHLKDGTPPLSVEQALSDQAAKHRQELAELKAAHSKALADALEQASRAQATPARPRPSTPLGGTRVAALSGAQDADPEDQESRGSKRAASPADVTEGSRQRRRFQSVAGNTPTPTRPRATREEQRGWIGKHLHNFIRRGGVDGAVFCKACKLDDRKANPNALLEEYIIGNDMSNEDAVAHVVDKHLETTYKLRDRRIKEGKE
ncbi:hypothetical protein Q8F55_002042 [Vanrija albida]|uniref:Uncharacterized protein n=1 Tax=Vanrija albida TaxID=181172 RepID=A0ABR3Q9A1_9TREE